MSKKRSILRGAAKANPSRTDHAHRRIATPSKPSLVGIGAAALMLCWAATSVSAGTGPGLAVKIGAQTLDSPIDGEKTTRVRMEAEVATALQADDRMDFFLSVGGSPLGTDRFTDIYESDGVLYEDYFSDSFSLIDVRLGARLYPLGYDTTIRPYIGGGIGYYWRQDSYSDEYYTTFEDPLRPGRYITYVDYASGTDTITDGFFSFVTAGVTVPVRSNIDLLFEFKYDFAKDRAGIDLGGPIYMFGAMIRL